MGIFTNKTKLQQQIHDKVSEPTNRLVLLPDQGLARAPSGSRLAFGTNHEVGFWRLIEEYFLNNTSFGNMIGSVTEQLLGFTKGLARNRITVDLEVRTPHRVVHFPNVELNTDTLGAVKSNEIYNKLYGDSSQVLLVHVIYSGGKPSECIPISWVEWNVSDQKIKEELESGKNGGLPINDYSSIGFGSQFNPTGGILARYKGIINEAHAITGVDANLIAAVVASESAGHNGASSVVGAHGLMQLMPGTFSSQIEALQKQGVKVKDDVWDPRSNIIAGSFYLESMLHEFGNNLSLALAAYNAGPGAVQKYGGVPPYKETRNYVLAVRDTYAKLNRQSAVNNGKPTAATHEIKNADRTKASSHSTSAYGWGAM